MSDLELSEHVEHWNVDQCKLERQNSKRLSREAKFKPSAIKELQGEAMSGCTSLNITGTSATSARNNHNRTSRVEKNLQDQKEVRTALQGLMEGAATESG